MVLVRLSGLIFSLVVMAYINAVGGAGSSQGTFVTNVASVSSASLNRDVSIKSPVNLDGAATRDALSDRSIQLSPGEIKGEQVAVRVSR